MNELQMHNAEARRRRRCYAAGEFKKAREYNSKALKADGYMQAIYFKLSANCYRSAYLWKRKSDIPVFKEV